MTLPKDKKCREDVEKAAQIKILVPRKRVKDCLADVGFSRDMVQNKSLQQRVRRLVTKLQKPRSSPSPSTSQIGHGVDDLRATDQSIITPRSSANETPLPGSKTANNTISTATTLPNDEKSWEDVAKAAQINVLVPKKNIKDCLADVGFSREMAENQSLQQRVCRLVTELQKPRSSRPSLKDLTGHDGAGDLKAAQQLISTTRSSAKMNPPPHSKKVNNAPNTPTMLPNDEKSWEDVAKASQIKILAPRKHIKDCLADVGFSREMAENRSLQQRVRRLVTKLQMRRRLPPSTALSAHNGAGSLKAFQQSTVPPRSSGQRSPAQGSKTANNAPNTVVTVPNGAVVTTKQANATTKVTKGDKMVQAKTAKTSAGIPRRNSKQVVKAQAARMVKKRKMAEAMSAATVLYNQKKGSMSSSEVCKCINREYSSNISASSLRRYVKKRIIGASEMLSSGRPSTIVDSRTYAILLVAFATSIQLKKANGTEEHKLTSLNRQVQRCLKVGSETAKRIVRNRLRRDAASSFNVGKDYTQEARRIAWATYSNLSIWFEQFEKDMLELGFAEWKEDGSVVFFDPGRIINLVATELGGGRHVASCFDGGNDRTVPLSSKSSGGFTGVFGSTAAGTPLPPHFQLKTGATGTEGKGIRSDVAARMHTARGRFGSLTGEEKLHPFTLGVNENGGMNAVEFQKYVESVRRLYEDCADVPGKRICIMVDSSLGRTDANFLTWAKSQGVVVYPGVPNTNSVKQELDRLDIPFKTGWYQSLAKLMVHRMKSAGGSGQPSLSEADCGLLLFGGKECDLELPNLFEKHFSVEANLKVWAKVGACPLTRACLKDAKVRHETIVEDNGTVDVTIAPRRQKLDVICLRNNTACDILNSLGYDGDALRVVLKNSLTQEKKPSTRANMVARKKARASANMPRQASTATDGTHLTDDDVIITLATKRREQEIRRREHDRSFRVQAEKRELDALSCIETLLTVKGISAYNDFDKLGNKELDVLLRWKLGVESLPSAITKNKASRLAKWAAVKNTSQPAFRNWTPLDERELHEFKTKELTAEDTAAAREFLDSWVGR